MVKSIVKLESDGASGSDRHRLGGGSRVDVTPQIVGIGILDRAVCQGLTDSVRGLGAASDQRSPDVYGKEDVNYSTPPRAGITHSVQKQTGPGGRQKAEQMRTSL